MRRTRRRTIAFPPFLAGAALVACLAAATAAAETPQAQHVVVRCTFDDGKPGDWKVLSGSDAAMAVVDDPGGGDRSLRLSSRCLTKPDRGQFGFAFMRQEEPFALQVRLKGTPRNRLYLRSADGLDALCFGFNDAGDFYTTNNGDKVVKKSAAGRWLDLRFDVDPKARTYGLSVDGERVAEQAPFLYRAADVSRLKIKQYEKTAKETGDATRTVQISDLAILLSVPPRDYVRSLLAAGIQKARAALARAGRAPRQKHDALAAAVRTASQAAADAQAPWQDLATAEQALAGAVETFLSVPAAGADDYAAIVRAYADEMIAYGRDDARYGPKTSPLFAVALRRDTEHAELLPYPQFYPNEKPVPGHLWNFCPPPDHGFLNIPKVGEDCHKQTVSGDDPHDQLGLYRALYLLSDVTKEDKYKKAADEALTWFFDHTQNPISGLYPWGEHLGWDFRHDYATYHLPGHEDFSDPARRYREPTVNGVPIVTEMYEGMQEEPRIYEFIPDFFKENFKRLHQQYRGRGPSPLEKYALGFWEQHFWNKEAKESEAPPTASIDAWADHFWSQLHDAAKWEKYKQVDKNGAASWVIPAADQPAAMPGARHNRHGDYFGLRRGVEGEYSAKNGMFPKYSGWAYDLFSYAYVLSDKPDFRARMLECLSKMTDGAHQVAWATQMVQAAYECEEAARRLRDATPAADPNRARVQGLYNKMMGFAKYTYERVVKPRTPRVLIVANATKDGAVVWTEVVGETLGDDFAPADMNVTRVVQAYTTTAFDEYRPVFAKWIENAVRKGLDRESAAADLAALAADINLLLWVADRQAEFPAFPRRRLLARADAMAREGVAKFVDITSPLPKFTDSRRLFAHDGQEWVPYYHAHAGCDDFMYALINLAAHLGS